MNTVLNIVAIVLTSWGAFMMLKNGMGRDEEKVIKIRGQATLKVDFAVELNISEEEFETFSVKKQNMLIDEAIDWRNTLRNAETDDIEVWEYEEVKGDSGD